MKINHPHIDKIWESFLGLNKLADFQQVANRIQFIDEVDDDVQKWFSLVKKLVVYSHFEYSFLDSALERAFIGFEFALKKKYCTLENQDINKVDKDFGVLINWAGKKGLFEIDKKIVHTLRDIRNDLMHTNRHQQLGILAFNFITEMVNLINDLYDDPNSRSRRKKLIRKVNKKLKQISDLGFKISLDGVQRIFFDIELLYLVNKEKSKKFCFAFCPVFDLPDNEENFHFEELILVVSDNYKINKQSLILGSKSSKLIAKPLNKQEQKEINTWYCNLKETFPNVVQIIKMKKNDYYNELRFEGFSNRKSYSIH